MYKTTRHNFKPDLECDDEHKTIDAAGCTTGQLRFHLARQFKPGMDFSNYGAWIIARIITEQYLDANDPEVSYRLNHWSNLRPIWPEDIDYNHKPPVHVPDYESFRFLSPRDSIINEHGIAVLKSGVQRRRG